MGVPSFFKWLLGKYPKISTQVKEETGPLGNDGRRGRVDCTTQNPNGIEFDNLYLDMNGIIHHCCHPEDKLPPRTEDEMINAIVGYIDRIFAICRPQKLLYIAIDGVAPRAKMNTQRSRRFKTARKHDELSQKRAELARSKVFLPPAAEMFDNNCITPGTRFMFRLAECLRYYVLYHLNNDRAWKSLIVILSDSNVPGEGEHKIMDFIRKQPGHSHYDPNTKHCLCGDDSDLILLGLATHKPNFTIIRKHFRPRVCEICGQVGHKFNQCTGQPNQQCGNMPVASEVDFIFIHLNVLREYLQRDLLFPTQGFVYDFEHVLDDWVFMCFLVGNDFLPRLKLLEGTDAIDRLLKIYKDTVQNRRAQGQSEYLVQGEQLDMEIFHEILKVLSEKECFSYTSNTTDAMLLEDDMVSWVNSQKKIAHDYARGLCWVLRYYFQGCASWDWYFPHCNPPIALYLGSIYLPNDFHRGTKPLRPLEHLMSVLPAASSALVPLAWRPLMYERDSPIINFYGIDLNGGALLPFVDEEHLLAVLKSKYADLTDEEQQRNQEGYYQLFVSESHRAYKSIDELNRSKAVELTPEHTQGMSGMIEKDDAAILPGRVKYENPKYPPDHVYPAVLLPNAQMPPPTLKGEGLQMGNRGNYRPQLGFQPNNDYRTDKDPSAARRMVGASIHAANAGRNPGSTVAPPSSYGGGGGRGGPRGGNSQRGAYGGGSGNYRGDGQGSYGVQLWYPSLQSSLMEQRYQPHQGYPPHQEYPRGPERYRHPTAQPAYHDTLPVAQNRGGGGGRGGPRGGNSQPGAYGGGSGNYRGDGQGSYGGDAFLNVGSYQQGGQNWGYGDYQQGGGYGQ